MAYQSKFFRDKQETTPAATPAARKEGSGRYQSDFFRRGAQAAVEGSSGVSRPTTNAVKPGATEAWQRATPAQTRTNAPASSHERRDFAPASAPAKTEAPSLMERVQGNLPQGRATLPSSSPLSTSPMARSREEGRAAWEASPAGLKARGEALPGEIEAKKSELLAELAKKPLGAGVEYHNPREYELERQIKDLGAQQGAVAGQYYYRSSAEALNALKKQPGIYTRYTDAKGKRKDLEKLTRAQMEAVADDYTYLQGKYGISPGDQQGYRDLITKLQRELDGEAKAIRAAGFDFDDLVRYEDKLADIGVQEQATKEFSQFADEHPILASGMSVLASPFQLLDAAPNLLHYAGRSDVADLDSYEPMSTADYPVSNYVSATRGTVAGKIEDNTSLELGGQNVASFLYQTGMSIADSAVQVGTLGPAASIFMGASAATNGARDIVSRGGTNQQAFWGGLAAGAAETIFEKVSIENLLKVKKVSGWKDMLREVAKQAGVEASEEMFTEIANILSDAAIMGESSNFDVAVRQYMDEGLNLTEATNKAFLDNITAVAWAGVGGALSGGVMGGVKNAVDYAAGRVNAGEGSGITNTAAERILADGDAVAELERTAGLTLDAAMTQSQRRAEVKRAVEGLASRSTATVERVGAVPPASESVPAQARQDGAASPSSRAETVAYTAHMNDAVQRGEALGERGKRAFQAALSADSDPVSYYKGFMAYYNAGMQGEKLGKVDAQHGAALDDAQRFAAWSAGQNDAAASLEAEKSGVGRVTVFNSEAGLVENEYSARLGEAERSTLHATARALGMKAVIDGNVQVGERQSAGNGYYRDGVLHIAADAADPVDVVRRHEVTHRLQELAPEAYRRFRDYAMRFEADAAQAVADKQLAYHKASGGEVVLSNSEAMDEIVADFAGRLLTDEATIQRLVKDDRTLGQKIRDVIRDLAQRFKEHFKTADPTLERAAQLWNDAYRAAEQEAGTRQKNTAQEGGVAKYSLGEYSHHQLENWAASKSIVVYKDQAQLRRFIQNALDGHNLGKKMYFGTISPDLAARIQSDAGVDVEGYNCAISAYEVRKILKNSHGDQTSEGLRGQRAITVQDILSIPEIITAPDSITLGEKTYEGRPVIQFVKEMDGRTTVISYVSQKHRDLTVQTMFSGKKRSLATTPGGASPVPHTSETLSGTAPTHSISADEGKSNAKFSLKDQKSIEEKLSEARAELERLESVDVFQLLRDGIDAMSQRNADIAKLKRRIYNLEHPRSDTLNSINKARQDANKKLDVEYLAAIESGDLAAAGRMVEEYARERGYIPESDYHIDHTAPTNDGYNAPIYDLVKIYPDDIYSSNAARYYGDGEGHDQGAISALWAVKGKPDKLISIYRAVPANVKEARIRNGDWVTVSRSYAEAHGKAHLDGYRIIENRVPAKHVFTDGNSINEQGYDSGKVMAYANTVNNAKLLDVVTLDGNGGIIPLSKRFNKRSSDMRYSLKDQSPEARAARLEELNEYLRAQLKVSKGAVTDKKAVAGLARSLLSEYSSDYDPGVLGQKLQGMYDRIANGRDLTWEGVRSEAQAIAEEILSGSLVRNDDSYQSYEALRKYVRGTKINVPRSLWSELDSVGGYNEFRRANMGRLDLSSNGGMPIDTMYKELSAQYPEFFNENEQVHPADQLMRLADVLDGLQPVMENPYSGSMNEASAYLAADIIERFYETPQQAPTYADRQARKMTQQKIHADKKLDRLRQQKNERIEAIRQQGKETVKEAVTRERARRAEQVQKVTDRYKSREATGRERRSASELRRKITRHASDLSQKLLRPSDKKHIPEALRKPVAALLEAINLESAYTVDAETGKRTKNGDGLPTRRTEAFQALRDAYRKALQSGEGLVLDPDLLGDDTTLGNLDAVIEMKDTRIADMSKGQLETVWNTVRAIEASISSVNKTLAKSRYATISEMAEELKSDFIMTKPFQERYGARGMLHKLVNVDMLSPVDYFKELGRAGDAMWEELRHGLDQKVRDTKAVSDYATDLIGETDVRKWSGSKTQMQTFHTSGGDIQLTPAQVMSLYLLMKRKQAHEHILKGGIRQAPVQAGGGGKIVKSYEPVHVTLEDVAHIIGSLTDEQRRIADGLGKFMSTTLSDWGNEVSMGMYGYKKFVEENYFPIRSDVNYTKTEFAAGQDQRVKNMGFTKSTAPHANNAIMVEDVFDVFTSHADDMSTYHAFAAVLEDVERVYNFRYRTEEGAVTGSVSQTIERVLGRDGKGYFRQLMKNINEGIRTDVGAEIPRALLSNYKAAAVGANLRVIVQQPTAIFRAGAIIDPKYLVAGMAKKGNFDLVKEWAPIAQWKDWGYFQLDTGRQMRSIMLGTDSALDKVRELAMQPAGWADNITWSRLWNAVELEVADKRPGLERGSDAFYRAVAERFGEVVDRTQVVDSVLHRSQTMRSGNTLVQMAASFMAEPTKTYNLFRTAAREVLTTGTKESRARLARVTVTLLVTAAATAAAAALVDALRDDDDDETYREKFLQAFTGVEGDEETVGDYIGGILGGNLGDNLNPLGMVPYGKDILSIWQGYDVDRMDMAAIKGFKDAADRWHKAVSGDGTLTVSYATMDLIGRAAKLLGLPIANVKRDLEGLVNGGFMALEAAGADINGARFTWSKFKTPLNDKNKNHWIDMGYRFERDGDSETAGRIYDALTGAGIPAEKIEERKRNILKKSEGFADQKEAVRGDIATDLERSRGYARLSNEQKEKALEQAKTYAYVTAMLAQDPEYTVPSTYNWVLKANGGASVGIEPWEYILFDLAYDMAESDKDADGKTVAGSKQEKVIDALDDMGWLTARERDYLYGTRYSSDKNNPYK